MRSNNRYIAIAALAAIALAACSSSSKASPSTSPATNAPATSAPATSAPGTSAPAGSTGFTVGTESTKDGTILVNSAGLTLYISNADPAGKSVCTGSCATIWPPLTVTGTPTYGTGVTASMFSTITRSDGTKQLAVNGKPLYLFDSDKSPKDVTGQGVNGFYVVMASTGKQ